jgi:hypothetical protein
MVTWRRANDGSGEMHEFLRVFGKLPMYAVSQDDELPLAWQR